MTGLICKIKDWVCDLQDICYLEKVFRISREKGLENCLKENTETESCPENYRESRSEKESRIESKQAGKPSPAEHWLPVGTHALTPSCLFLLLPDTPLQEAAGPWHYPKS